MPVRPTSLPSFATDPGSSADVVEPISDVRNAGFATTDRPPAQWFNWLFFMIGQWLGFLRGPNPAQWTRTAMTPTIKRADVDTTSVEDATVLFRVAGVDPATMSSEIYVTRRGNEWVTNAINVAAGSIGIPTDIMFHTTDSVWILATDQPRILWTYPSGHVSSAIDVDATDWSSYTLPGGTTAIIAISRVPSGGPTGPIVAITATDIMWGPVLGAFNSATILGGAPAGSFTSVVYTGSAWIAVTSAGELYRATSQNGSFTKLATVMGSATWRLAADGNNNVFAVRRLSVHSANSYLSADNGATWNAQTSPPFDGFTDVQYIDGAWFLTCTSAPYIATAPDTAHGSWLRLPTPYIETGGLSHQLQTVVLSEGQMIALGVAFVLQSTRAVDLSPAPWVPGNTPAPLYDAAYLRGYEVHNTAPQDGDTLVWDAANTRWDPGVDPYVQTAVSLPITTHTRIVGVTSTAAARTVTLNSAVRAGTVVTVYDESNAAGGAHPITIATTSGNIYLNGVSAATQSIATNGGSLSFYFDGTDWRAF